MKPENRLAFITEKLLISWLCGDIDFEFRVEIPSVEVNYKKGGTSAAWSPHIVCRGGRIVAAAFWGQAADLEIDLPIFASCEKILQAMVEAHNRKASKKDEISYAKLYDSTKTDYKFWSN